MQQHRLVGVLAVVALALCLVEAPVASAVIPTFKPATTQTFKVASQTVKIEDSTGAITCEDSKGNGEIIGEANVKAVQISLFHCEGQGFGSTTKCNVMSTGSTNGGEIQFKTLKGELGEVTSGATSKSGLLLLPETGRVFATVLGTCLNESAIEGAITGEATPVRVSQITNKLVFLGAAGSQSIKNVTTKVMGQAVSLKGFGLPISINTTEEVTYSIAVEVT
jgi:hypothetical protein